MGGLLDTKTATDGKNTDLFPDRNMLIGTSQLKGREGSVFILAKEKYVEYEGVRTSPIALQNDLQSNPLVIRTYTV